ncbi:MAG: long-chain fatty acid--CoA ligase [bacterium]
MIHGNWLAKWAQVEPDKQALIDLNDGRGYTYLELDRRADRAARLLSEQLGVGRGDRVAVLGENRVEQVELYFAAVKLGAVLVPVNWRLSPEEVAYILGDAEPAVLFYGQDMDATATALAAGLWTGPLVSFDDAEGYPARQERASADPVVTEGITEDSPVMLLYTSGTTGRAKGAILTHGTITWNAINTATSWDLRQDDVTITHTPFFHTGGWNVLTLPLLHRGATVVLASRFDPGQTLRAIARHGVTVMFAVPTMFQMLIDHPELGETDLSTVRFFISGGAPCPIPLIEAFQRRGVVFKQGYGLTEVGPNCFVLHERDAIRKAGSVGFPVLHLDTRIVSTDGLEVAPNEVGELQLRGPTVCAGYWKNADASAAARCDGWFATGDLFRRDGDGYHFVVGRLKELFISGGENVYPAEVERVLYEVDAVVEAAVIGVPDEKWGEVGHAFVALAEGTENLPGAEEILATCRQRLARYKVPKKLTILDSLPKGPSGKIQKTELQKRN